MDAKKGGLEENEKLGGLNRGNAGKKVKEFKSRD